MASEPNLKAKHLTMFEYKDDIFITIMTNFGDEATWR